VAVVVMASAAEDVAAAVAAEAVAVANSIACSAAAIASMTECVRVNKYSRALDCKQHREVSAQAVRHVMVRLHYAQQDTCQSQWHISANQGPAAHRTAGKQQNMAQQRIVGHSTAQHSTAQHSTAQHSTAQHSTAQHSTAPLSTAQHSKAQSSTAQQSKANMPGSSCQATKHATQGSPNTKAECEVDHTHGRHVSMLRRRHDLDFRGEHI